MWDDLDKAIEDVIDITNGDIDNFFDDKKDKDDDETKKDDKKDEKTDTDEKGSKINSERLSIF